MRQWWTVMIHCYNSMDGLKLSLGIILWNSIQRNVRVIWKSLTWWMIWWNNSFMGLLQEKACWTELLIKHCAYNNLLCLQLATNTCIYICSWQLGVRPLCLCSQVIHIILSYATKFYCSQNVTGFEKQFQITHVIIIFDFNY